VNLPLMLLTVRWMLKETFRQSLASKLFWVVFSVTSIVVMLCLSVRVTGVDALPTEKYETPTRLNIEEIRKIGRDKLQDYGPLVSGIGVEAMAIPFAEQLARKDGVDVFQTELSLGFGLIQVTKSKDKTDAVRFLQIFLAGAVADTAGIFLVLIWTAGFLPTFLDPAQVTVLLAKPVQRWHLLLGKYLGVVAFVALQASIFVGATWLALGLRTGVFDPLYLLAIPLVVIQFIIFYSFSALLAVVSRNTVVCVFGVLLFWVMCWGMNFGRHVIAGLDLPGVSGGGSFMLEAGYWILPKPGDLSLILYDALQADGFSMKLKEFEKVQALGLFQPQLSLLASLLFAAATFAMAAFEFEKTDY
jgi:ABC-type transport system involved in multi-copper enzyme maturation permease subunit